MMLHPPISTLFPTRRSSDLSQTFGFRAAETVDEAVQLCGGNGVGEYENIEVFLGVFNYAATLRQHNAANDVLQSDNFVPAEGVWDISSAVAEKVERAKMTPRSEERRVGKECRSRRSRKH